MPKTRSPPWASSSRPKTKISLLMEQLLIDFDLDLKVWIGVHRIDYPEWIAMLAHHVVFRGNQRLTDRLLFQDHHIKMGGKCSCESIRDQRLGTNYAPVTVTQEPLHERGAKSS